MSLHLFSRRAPKHGRAAGEPAPAAAKAPAPQGPKTAVSADLGDGFDAAFAAADRRMAARQAAQNPEVPAVRPLPVSPFGGASGTGVMEARENPETPGERRARLAGERRARLASATSVAEAAPDLLEEMTLLDLPAAVLRPDGTVTAATSGTAGEEGPDQERPPAGRGYAPPNLAGGTPGDPGPVHASCAPASFLRVMTARGGTWEPLGGQPFFAGQRTGPDGRRAVGIGLGEVGRGAHRVWDTSSAERLDALEAAVRQARDALVYDGFRPVPAEDAPAGAVAETVRLLPAAEGGETA
jgi:hypothetical protein